MAMQVETEPQAASPSLQVRAKRASLSPEHDGAVRADLLSPVSKLQLARKQAAEEQQQRIDAACARVVQAKKKKEMAAISSEVREVVDHMVREEQEPEEMAQDEEKTSALRSLARRVSSVFKRGSSSSTEDSEEPEEKYSPTRELLRATRSKLQALVSSKAVEEDGDADGMVPSTNYHLKQLGLSHGNINIYASEAEQQSELRRHRKSALLCREKFLQDKTLADDGYDSSEDPDFHAGDDQDEDPDEDEDESSKNEEDGEDGEEDGEEAEEVDMDPDELEQLLRERDQFLGTTSRRGRKTKTKTHSTARRLTVGIPVFLLSFVVLLIALVLAAEQAQQRLGWCTGTDRASPMCKALEQTQQIAQALQAAVQRQLTHQ